MDSEKLHYPLLIGHDHFYGLMGQTALYDRFESPVTLLGARSRCSIHHQTLLFLNKNIYTFNIGYIKTKKQGFNVSMFCLHKYYFCISNSFFSYFR